MNLRTFLKPYEGEEFKSGPVLVRAMLIAQHHNAFNPPKPVPFWSLVDIFLIPRQSEKKRLSLNEFLSSPEAQAVQANPALWEDTARSLRKQVLQILFINFVSLFWFAPTHIILLAQMGKHVGIAEVCMLLFITLVLCSTVSADVQLLGKWRQFQKYGKTTSSFKQEKLSADGIPTKALWVLWWITPAKQRRDSIAMFKDDFEIVKEDLGIEGAQKWAKGEAVKTIFQVLDLTAKRTVVGVALHALARWLKCIWGL